MSVMIFLKEKNDFASFVRCISSGTIFSFYLALCSFAALCSFCIVIRDLYSHLKARKDIRENEIAQAFVTIHQIKPRFPLPSLLSKTRLTQLILTDANGNQYHLYYLWKKTNSDCYSGICIRLEYLKRSGIVVKMEFPPAKTAYSSAESGFYYDYLDYFVLPGQDILPGQDGPEAI